MTNSTETAAELIEIGQAHIKLLIERQWPEMGEILESENELTLSFSLAIDAGSKEVKSKLSFSKKFTADTTSKLHDAAQGELPLDQQTPASKFQYDLAELIDRAVREYPDESLLKITHKAVMDLDPDSFVCPPEYNPEDYIAQQFASFLTVIKERVESRSSETGGDEEKGQGKTPMDAAIDAATLASTAPKIALVLPELPLKTGFSFQKKFRAAAKKAGWNAAQMNFMIAEIDKAETAEARVALLAPHCVAPEPEAPKTVIVAECVCPLLPLVLEPGFAAERTMAVFEKEARIYDWPEKSIEAVRTHVDEICTEAGDATAQANEATHTYLSQFCREPVAE